MAVSECFVSVVAPVYNDSTIVENFIAAVMTVLQKNYSDYELVLVDDGSEDDTVAIITAMLGRYKCIRLIRLSRKFGEEIAISAGLDSVIGDFTVIMLANSDPPQLIPQIIDLARKKGAAIVFGICDNRSSYTLLTRIGSYLFHCYCKWFLKLNLPKGSTQYRVLSRPAVNAIVQIKDRNRYLRVVSSHIGYATQSFVYEAINRKGIPKRMGFLDAASIAINIIIRTSKHPLRLVSWFGITASMINLIYTGFIIYSFVFGDYIAEGWVTLSLQSSVMFFFVFLILTVLSEYIGLIFVESEHRPLYYVLEERNSSVLVVDPERKNVVTNSVIDESASPVINNSR